MEKGHGKKFYPTILLVTFLAFGVLYFTASFDTEVERIGGLLLFLTLVVAQSALTISFQLDENHHEQLQILKRISADRILATEIEEAEEANDSQGEADGPSAPVDSKS